MLASKYRLKDYKVLKNIQNEGKLIQSESFGLVYTNRNDTEMSKFGFVVSTKISKQSAHRNRIRRALNEGVRINLAYIRGGYDVIFLTKPAALKIPTEGIMGEVRKSLTEVGVIK
ncbi:ribonuclease P protein component [Candidatus Woesebacteria bacterium]|nr:ribonuclease P protein component [Candidatus Woesebacteria bacterium]